jgi:hypothetical protein
LEAVGAAVVAAAVAAAADRPVRYSSIFDATVVGYSVDRIAIVFAVALLLLFNFYKNKILIELPKIKLSQSGGSCC